MTTLLDLLEPPPPTPPWQPYTPTALARVKGCNERTVRRAIARKELLAHDANHGYGRPLWIVLWRDAEDWVPNPEGWAPGRPRRKGEDQARREAGMEGEG